MTARDKFPLAHLLLDTLERPTFDSRALQALVMCDIARSGHRYRIPRVLEP